MNANTAIGSPATATATARPGTRAMVRSLGLDVGLPIILYYGGHALGMSNYAALMAGTLACAARAIWVAVRSRRLDVFAGFLLVVFGVGLALSFATGDARFMLLKDSAGSMAAGLIFLISCAIGKPLTFYAAQRFAGPAAADLRAATNADPALRKLWNTTSLVWGVGLLVEATIRIPVVYLLPIGGAVAASTALQVAAFAVLIGWTARIRRRHAAAGSAKTNPVRPDESGKWWRPVNSAPPVRPSRWRAQPGDEPLTAVRPPHRW